MDQERGHPHLLLWYVSGDLDPAQTRETEAHLSRCRDCSAEARALSSMLQNLKEDGFTGELPGRNLTALTAEYDPTPARARTPGVWKRRLPALTASAAAVMVLVVG